MTRTEALAGLAVRAISGRVFPGCVVGLVDTQGAREAWPFGRLTYAENAPLVAEDTIYDLASITKSVPLASLALTFVSEGKLRLDDKVQRWLPELHNDFGATIEDLLRYRVRGLRMSTLSHRTFEELQAHIFERGFDGPAGESDYANLPAYLLGLIVERAGGGTLPALSQRYFFEPLGMKDTTFFPHDPARVAPTEVVAGKEVRGVVHDESARTFARAHRAVGHAGLFSTAPDILHFLEALLQGKFPAVADGASRGLGWQTKGDFLGPHPEGRFGKTGFTGTSIALDMQRGIGLVILSNRTYPRRPPDDAAINAFRRETAHMVFAP